MQPRAFVIMPFGKNPPGHDFSVRGKAPRADFVIDFDRIYQSLFKPALEKAGYEVARADSAANAGGIRTDMFFELVTADLVVADLSILNANVYYELGVRQSSSLTGFRPHIARCHASAVSNFWSNDTH